MLVEVTAETMDGWFGADQVVRFPEESLPAGLAHEGSRRFLAEVGLMDDEPEVRLLDAPAPLAEVFRRGSETEKPPEGTERFIVFGTLHDYEHLALDRESGRVHLVDRDPYNPYDHDKDEPLETDLLATDLSSFVFAMRQVREARTGWPESERFGLAVYEHVVAQATAAIQAVDPDLFDENGVACLWTTWLAMWALPWGLGPAADVDPGADRLMYDLDPALLTDMAPDPIRLPPHKLPPDMTHEPTRRFLGEVGLPRQVPGENWLLDLHEDFEAAPRTYAQRCPEEFPPDEPPSSERAGQVRDCLDLGGWAYGCGVLVDGRTGHVVVTEGEAEDWPPLVLNTDLSAFVGLLWMVSRGLRLRDAEIAADGDWQVFMPAQDRMDIIARLAAVMDPDACADDEESGWPMLLEDGHMSVMG